jgi:S-DNA-T family DNA segregation ATPase FtsK/SpoIIIE
MLELSVYDRIPHLLAPVVTEPPKAIGALKWTVREMEKRYRAMSSIGVRNIAGYNEKLQAARARGEVLTRRVQTGFDPETNKPMFEDQTLALEPLPMIVVVIDEMADLMIVAGKEIEAAVQRLAQMARAAGIHVIMATQRPSVDVITGTIKANFPSRISFQVTSKIDSRTILGEPGAEQLLGKGDMLWMAGGKLVRVHGPFVSDGEVEAVADFWRAQGVPDYVEAVTEEPTDLDGQLDLASAGLSGGRSGDEEADVYAKAIDVVAKAQKASTSFIQRHLRIGYNNAARLIERMEQDGFVSRPDHVGRREVLIDEYGQRR